MSSTAYDQTTGNAQVQEDDIGPHLRGRRQVGPSYQSARFEGMDGLTWVGVGIMVGAFCLSAAAISNALFQNGRGSGSRQNQW